MRIDLRIAIVYAYHLHIDCVSCVLTASIICVYPAYLCVQTICVNMRIDAYRTTVLRIHAYTCVLRIAIAYIGVYHLRIDCVSCVLTA